MAEKYSLVGKNTYMDSRGRLFEKTYESYKPIQTKYTQAEDRYVQRNLGKGVLKHEEN